MKKALQAFFGSWFELTVDERKALCLVLAIFLLGLIIRYAGVAPWRDASPKPASTPVPVEPAGR